MPTPVLCATTTKTMVCNSHRRPRSEIEWERGWKPSNRSKAISAALPAAGASHDRQPFVRADYCHHRRRQWWTRAERKFLILLKPSTTRKAAYFYFFFLFIIFAVSTATYLLSRFICLFACPTPPPPNLRIRTYMFADYR